ncbi:BGTF surface domain-containing protein [Halosimplex sp. TS25]|uniref:BGTF surface domain-containing protein n=1 Tax=Halosimplex rarum TaxID=3396619 RepID=UPI0039E82012
MLCLSAIAFAGGIPAAADSHVAIEEGAVEQARGDVATFTLSIPRGESVAFVLDGSGSHRHRLNLTDVDPNGRITLSLNTHLAGPNASAHDIYSVAGQDALSVVGNETDGQLESATYRAEVYANATADEPADTAGLSLTDPGLANATVMVAPDGKREALSSRAAIRRAQREGWLTRSDRYAVGDTFVLRLTAPGIAGAVANESGPSDVARFRSFLARQNTSLMLIDKRPGPSLGRVSLYLDAANVTTVVADPDNDTYYVATDLTTLPWSSDYDEKRSFSDPYLIDGDAYVPRFVVEGKHRLNPGDIAEANRTGYFTVSISDATVAFSNETAMTVQVGPAPNQTITGYANVAPGTAVTVRLFNGSGEPFPITETARVTRASSPTADSEENLFRATVDLSGADPGTEFLIEIGTNGTLIDGPYRGFVDPELAPTATPTPTPTETPTPTPTATVTPTEPPHRNPGMTPTETQTPTATTETTAGDGPGFGALAALLGLTALAAIGVCRTGGRSQ